MRDRQRIFDPGIKNPYVQDFLDECDRIIKILESGRGIKKPARGRFLRSIYRKDIL